MIDEISPEFIGEMAVTLPSSPEVMESICAQMRRAEEARQEAIANLMAAIDTLSVHQAL